MDFFQCNGCAYIHTVPPAVPRRDEANGWLSFLFGSAYRKEREPQVCGAELASCCFWLGGAVILIFAISIAVHRHWFG